MQTAIHQQPIISKGSLQMNQLQGMIALVTGAGGGIGFETARALVWLGARVIIAEIDANKGNRAIDSLDEEFGEGKASFIPCDISNDESIKALIGQIQAEYGHVDAIVNNATIAPIGAVHEVGVAAWDKSYRVNLRGPVQLVSHLLPDMLKRNAGIIVFVPSSGAAPYMGAYEVFKTSQVELCNTLAGELEGTGVITFSIGPGIVKTETANAAIEQLAPLYHKSVDEFFQMNEAVLISPEEAGAGFAAAIAMAVRYRGTEISSLQALKDAGIPLVQPEKQASASLSQDKIRELMRFMNIILQTFTEQSEGWSHRNVFERQWVFRDFKKQTGQSPDMMMDNLRECEQKLTSGETPGNKADLSFDLLRKYYVHQMDLLKGFEKNPDKLRENLAIMDRWVGDIDEFMALLTD